MVSCVIHGTSATTPTMMPVTTLKWTGRLPRADVEWSIAQKKITVASGVVGVLAADGPLPVSPYQRRFRQGAVLAPRVLLFVEPAQAGPLGAGAGRVAVASRRTTLEKKPWIDLPSLLGTVERQFVHDVYLGETIAPFRVLKPLQAVLPVTSAQFSRACPRPQGGGGQTGNRVMASL